ncbi:MAG: SLBB domain-containing protein [Bacteroidales bacterium]|nr:SLBB domain-containing protein [Bacteroidales bacterium]
MKKILTAIACILLSLTALAQSANMLSLARAELAKRGLEENEVRTRLLEEGIDVDTIPPSEYPAYQTRVMEIINKMEAEKATSNAAVIQAAPAADAAVVANAAAGTEIIAAAASSAETPNQLPQTTLGEAAAEEALEHALKENHVSTTAGDDIYGHALFTGTSMDVFRTTDGAQAPETYILGEGDEIHISIFGGSQTEIHQRVAPDGSIQPAGSTKIFLKGMTLAQARKAVIAKLAQHYSFRQDQIAVTITTARTLSVSIYGEVGVQGGFTLSALNTAFNALAAAGGPTAIGSIRNIQRSRAGKTARLDLYKYMKGEIKDVPYDLQNNDVLFVPIAQNIVTIEGAVRRPMRYEMLDGESLKDLIEYAGGLTYNASPDFVQIERRENGELKYLEYELDKTLAGAQKVRLEGGDVIRIKSTNRPMENYVSISGEIYYGGDFDIEKNSSLKGLLDRVQPKYTARTDYVFVERTSPDETVEVFTVPFPGTDGNPDFELQARDKVKVLALDTFKDTWSITVEGDVRDPFTRRFGINDSMTLAQAIEYAGGPRTTARTDYVFVERTKPDETVEVLTVPFPGTDGNPDFKLQTRDVVRVLAQSTYRDTETISVSGQVRNPFTRSFGLNDRMTIGQAIEYAGGLKPTVYPVAFIFRTDVTNPAKKEYIPVSLEKDVDQPLLPGDELRVYDNTTYTNIGEIRVSGAVKNPVSITYDPSVSLHDIITMAGGFTVGASYDKVQVFRMNISKKDAVTFDTINVAVDENYYPVNPNFQLQPYDHVVVRMTPNFTHGRTVEINGRVKYPGVYVIEDGRTQLTEILRMAGGLLDDASPYATLFRTYKGRGNIGVNLDDARRIHVGKNYFDPILMDGDVINVTRLENTVIIRELGTRMAQYTPEEFSSVQKIMIYQGPHSAKWYIDHYAGGLIKTADNYSVTVTMSNSQTEGTKRLLGIPIYPTVQPGSVITVTIDQQKKQKIEKPKEKIDWERLAASTLSTLTSVTSMILLIERLN